MSHATAIESLEARTFLTAAPPPTITGYLPD